MTISNAVRCTFAAALSIAAGAGCSSSPESPAPAASQGGEATPEEPINAYHMLRDGQSLRILATVDTGEVAQAQIAVSRASVPQVRNFASEMIQEHNRAKAQGVLLASQADITPASSSFSRDIQAKSTTMLENLESAAAGSFDFTYMQGQIQQHQDVLKLLDDKMIPAAVSPDLRNHLISARAMIQHHVAHAQQVYDGLTPP